MAAVIAGLALWAIQLYLYPPRYFVAFLGTTVLAVLVSTVCFRCVERPARALAVLALILGAYCVCWSWLFAFGPDKDELQAEGDAFVEALGRHWTEKRSYPSSLSDVGCEPRWNRFGGWTYQRSADGSSWQLAVGDYAKDGFVLYRSAGDAEWYWDE